MSELAERSLSEGAARIVSLLPSATEIVCALGAEPDLVGISHECDFPEHIRDRAVLTRPRIDAGGSSQAIDLAVRSVIASALSVYAIDEERLAALAPDIVVTQDLCEVCAVSLDDVRGALGRLGCARTRILSLRPLRLGDVLDDILRVAAALGRRVQGAALRAALEQRISLIAARALAAPAKPRVVSVEWLEPLMLGGTWMPELIELAGGVPLGVAPGQPAPSLAPAALAELRPDVVLIKPCGFTLERTLAERAVIERDILANVGRARVYVSDGNAFFNRPGPRLVESLEILASALHPELFASFARAHAASVVRLA